MFSKTCIKFIFTINVMTLKPFHCSYLYTKYLLTVVNLRHIYDVRLMSCLWSKNCQ